MGEVVYLTLDELLAIHGYLMVDTMRSSNYGILSENQLQGALARPRQAAFYQNASLLRQAAVLFHGLVMNHGFIDGNKRTAFMALQVVLADNDHPVVACDVKILTHFVEDAAAGKFDPDHIEAWLANHTQ